MPQEDSLPKTPEAAVGNGHEGGALIACHQAVSWILPLAWVPGPFNFISVYYGPTNVSEGSYPGGGGHQQASCDGPGRGCGS